MIETLVAHFKKNLPFVAYRKPNATLMNIVFQHDDIVHEVSDFTESGFVFAPFDATKQAILILHLGYSVSSGKGEIIICALCVPGFIIQG